ncbi:unnamed protein product [Choristocarpus tenellus]
MVKTKTKSSMKFLEVKEFDSDRSGGRCPEEQMADQRRRRSAKQRKVTGKAPVSTLVEVSWPPRKRSRREIAPSEPSEHTPCVSGRRPRVAAKVARERIEATEVLCDDVDEDEIMGSDSIDGTSGRVIVGKKRGNNDIKGASRKLCRDEQIGRCQTPKSHLERLLHPLQQFRNPSKYVVGSGWMDVWGLMGDQFFPHRTRKLAEKLDLLLEPFSCEKLNVVDQCMDDDREEDSASCANAGDSSDGDSAMSNAEDGRSANRNGSEGGGKDRIRAKGKGKAGSKRKDQVKETRLELARLRGDLAAVEESLAPTLHELAARLGGAWRAFESEEATEERERVVKVLEKWQPENEKHHAEALTIIAQREEEQQALCYVCGSGETLHDDAIVFCDRCSVAVHCSCYKAKGVSASVSHVLGYFSQILGGLGVEVEKVRQFVDLVLFRCVCALTEPGWRAWGSGCALSFFRLLSILRKFLDLKRKYNKQNVSLLNPTPFLGRWSIFYSGL